MDKDLQAILDRMPCSSNEVFNQFLLEAREGYEDALPQIARMLHHGIGVPKDDTLVDEITCWCRREGACPSWLIEVPHVMDPALSYREDEILRLITLYKRGEFRALGVAIKAVQQERALYERFSGDMSRLLKRKDDEDREYGLWQAVWSLDERLNTNERMQSQAMEAIQGEYISDDDPYIAIAYLEKVVSYSQTDACRYVFEEILSALEENSPVDVYAFYRGLFQIVEGSYTEAWETFLKSSDKRCRLSQAYMLIHGIGVTQDLVSAMRILKDYPEDGYALYLLAVARYKVRPDRSIVPEEVNELLMESHRLGYQPAKSALLMMRYQCDPLSTGKIGSSFQREIQDYGLKMRDRDALGLFQYHCYREQMMSDDLDEEEQLAKALTGGAAPYSPLGNYAVALLALEVDEPTDVYWEKAARGINQSSSCRLYGVRNALMDYLFGDKPSDLEGMLTLLGNMGTSSRDLEDLFCVISLYRCSPNKSLIQKLAESMVERFCQPTATDLEKLLAALLCYAGYFQIEDREVVIRSLKETDKVSDPLLRRIRNKLIRANLLQEEIPLSAEKEMDTLGVDWLDHFIGYHFFHYA